MGKTNNEIETVVFQALSHPMRRTIIKLLETHPHGMLYTQLITELGLSTGKMNYHIEQLQGLIEKNEQHQYVLTTLGKKALNQLNQLKNEVTVEDTKYLKIAERSTKTSLEPTLKSFIIIGIIACSVVLVGLIAVAIVALTSGGFPSLMLLMLPLAFTIEIAVLGTLIHALKKAPQWIRRLERRFLQN
ncbi:MAG: hypothetical protein ACFCUE_11660 [Candidatus Bathyarchaeia archaeon]|jgi:predicted transcriptional regulator